MNYDANTPISPHDAPNKKLATRTDLKRMGITLSNTTLLRLEARGRFPRRVRIGGTSVAWLMSELNDWLSDRAEERARTHYADY